ncbi:hypothetical protein Nepgr_007153 [Nepenthes gracilis]|uniref:Uncharacterized protein n=1 Tax=Nepenthes gracilis TaxID=150966 RepID=A0AAD3S6B2_NEPGR|nr:hypothetical protein Nepgr_007153 [Nepenthes gracilis]
MGNCCGRGSSMVFAGEDWGSISDNKSTAAEENEGLLVRDPLSPVPAATGLRIKISKKQLEELLKGVDGAGGRKMSVEKVLGMLIQKSDHFEIRRRRLWRPALQTIPEVD